MAEDIHPGVAAIEAHDDLVQHMEDVGRKMRIISGMAVVVGGLLAAGFLSQLLVIPYVLGIRSQTVNLLDPALVIVELFLTLLTLAWAYLSFRHYIFARRLLGQVKQIRAMEDQLENRMAR